MTVSLVRLDQLYKPDTFDDQKNAAAIAGGEASSVDYADFQEFVLSQIKRIIWGNAAGNWHDDIATVHGGDASLKALYDATDLEEKDFLCWKSRDNYRDQTPWVILQIAIITGVFIFFNILHNIVPDRIEVNIPNICIEVSFICNGNAFVSALKNMTDCSIFIVEIESIPGIEGYALTYRWGLPLS